jgi:hypothetical protein
MILASPSGGGVAKGDGEGPLSQLALTALPKGEPSYPLLHKGAFLLEVFYGNSYHYRR